MKTSQLFIIGAWVWISPVPTSSGWATNIAIGVLMLIVAICSLWLEKGEWK